jgi:hypothetical protein
MDPRAYRVAQAFVEAHVRRAKYAPEFLQWVGDRKFRNPETGNEVKFLSLPTQEQRRVYSQWAKAKGVQEQPEQQTQQDPQAQTHDQIEQRNADIARQGEVVASEVLSEGGRAMDGEGGSPGINQSFIVKMRLGDQEQVYIRKPAEGEERHLRVGIPGGTYHAREQAAYQLDRMLGGEGVVPTTVTRGADDGSYQVWVDGARAMHGEDLDELVGKVKPEDLQRSPDFQRLNLFDLISGHEDRHRGNLLYHFDGDETPENLRFVAIDNGMTMASPSDVPDHRAYYHPFGAFYLDDESKPKHEREQDGDVARHRGNKAVAASLSEVSPDLHAQLRGVKMDDAARAMTSSGVTEPGAVRAALVRIAALQEDPKVFQQFLRRHNGNLEEAWQNFQHSSGDKNDLLGRAGAEGRAEEIDAALGAAKPEGGWTEPEKLENFFQEAQKEMEGFDSWGVFAETGKAPDSRDDDVKTRKEAATTVRDRWLRSALRRSGSSTGKPSRAPP